MGRLQEGSSRICKACNGFISRSVFGSLCLYPPRLQSILTAGHLTMWTLKV